MEQGYLLDTNIVIYFLQGRLPIHAIPLIKDVLKKKAKLSIISKIELLSWAENSKTHIDFVNDSNVFLLEDAIIDRSIEIRKKYKTNLPDAIIAATRIVHGQDITYKKQI
jgi:predicted nucleic acid-binding protein